MLWILCLVVLFTASLSHAAEGLQKLRVAYAAITAAFSIPWIAKEAGLYQRHGLDVELIYIASGPRAIQTMVGGGIDIAAFGGAAAIDARLAGADTVYVAIPVNRLIFFTVVAPHIKGVEDLRGKVVGATRIGTLTDYFTRVYLRQSGLVPDRDVTIRGTGGLPETLAALKAGQIQAGTFGFPAVLHAQAAGFRVLVDYATLGYRYPLSTVAVTQSMIRTRESAVRGFLAAYVEGIHRFRTDPAFAMKVIGKYTQTTDRKMLEETHKVYAPAFERAPYPEPEDLKLAIDQVSELNPRARGADPRDFVEPRFIRDIEASGLIKRLYGEQK
ncbi:MAG: ABC transporter substrate-binding protein [Deltaproteobacteria bacterium]|nr:ABC transporter substrate-binding protein [Deltaproteobacteria bacterium]MBI2227473.1 ABC transporter substrate-binding protein [Deltaproteobacteria bacterium]MBI2368175.1 ABC transporter substrate-binding protein [Deltaproteobacteria bacterium]